MSEIIFTMRPPSRRRVRLGKALAWTLIALGSLALADAIVTLVWQEPISAIYASVRQHNLEGQLHEIERRGPSRQERLALERTKDAQRKVVLLAQHMERSTKPGSAIGRIDIPRIKSNFVLINGTGTSELEAGPGIYSKRQYGVVFPGVPGTTAIAGHRTTFLEPFKHIAELHRGEHIIITMPYARFTYTITGKRSVLPTNTAAVVDRKRYTRLVLSSCTPEFSATERLLVYARLQRVKPRGPALIGLPKPRPAGYRFGQALSATARFMRS
ncbi:MAG TPA: class E sortase [Solirubrobacteraceae bacterium]|jgi:sortase A